MEFFKIFAAIKWVALLTVSSLIIHRLLDRVLPLPGRWPDRAKDDSMSVFEEALL